MSINFVVNCHFTKIALLGLTHFLGTVSSTVALQGLSIGKPCRRAFIGVSIGERTPAEGSVLNRHRSRHVVPKTCVY